jgi:predicted DNA-binding protein YlxM (UPF0122 family)
VTTLGKYADLPLPDDWLTVLRRLQPLNIQLKRPKTPPLGELLDCAAKPLNKRERSVIFLRFGQDQTLEQIGDLFDITRERIRQIEKKAIKKIRALSPKFMATLHEHIKKTERSGFFVADLASGQSHYFPDATGEELWRCCFEIYVRATDKSVVTQPLNSGGWVCYFPKRIRTKILTRYLDKKCRFISLEDAAQHLDIEIYDLVHGWSLFEGVYLTTGGLLGSHSWTILPFVEAIAWELAEAGFTEWHFSEMAKALQFVYPNRFSDMNNRNVAAALSRKDTTAFQFAGQKGQWQLRAFGDGYDNNKEAIIAVLKESGTALHYKMIYQRLQRPVRLETVYALLDRDDDFRSYGDGIYGLTDLSSSCQQKQITAVKTTGEETNVVDLILNMLQGTGHPLEVSGSNDEDDNLIEEQTQEEVVLSHKENDNIHAEVTDQRAVASQELYTSSKLIDDSKVQTVNVEVSDWQQSNTLEAQEKPPQEYDITQRILKVMTMANRPMRIREIAKVLEENHDTILYNLRHELQGDVINDYADRWYIVSK